MVAETSMGEMGRTLKLACETLEKFQAEAELSGDVNKRMRVSSGASRVAAFFLLRACRRHYPGESQSVPVSLASRSAAVFPYFRRADTCVARFEACSAFTARSGPHLR